MEQRLARGEAIGTLGLRLGSLSLEMPEVTADSAADALISLPTDVLDDILTRLDLLDAVRTSVLSRAWRRRWESLPSFDICVHQKWAQPPLWAVDSILLRCSGRVRYFDVILDDLSARRMDDWLLALSRRGVEYLNLSRLQNKFISLHSALFSCRRLVSLELSICEIPPLSPDFEGFPDLKALILTGVKLQENGEYHLEEIIERSPLLEELVLTDVVIDGGCVVEWEIRGPKLQHLTICSEIDYGWNFAEMPCLRSAVIDLQNYIGERDFTEFVAGLGQVSKLEISMFYTPINRVTILEALPCLFHNLKSLKYLMNFDELSPILSFFCFVRSAPNLEELKILIYRGVNENIEATEEFLNARWVDGMCAKLQVLRMTGTNWLPNEMSFMKFILSKAQLLHNLYVSHDDECLMSHEEALDELQKCTRASAAAQILFEGPAQYY